MMKKSYIEIGKTRESPVLQKTKAVLQKMDRRFAALQKMDREFVV